MGLEFRQGALLWNFLALLKYQGPVIYFGGKARKHANVFWPMGDYGYLRSCHFIPVRV